jgi:hypothetical protein
MAGVILGHVAPSCSAQQTTAGREKRKKKRISAWTKGTSIAKTQTANPYDDHYIAEQFPQTTFPRDVQYDPRMLWFGWNKN